MKTEHKINGSTLAEELDTTAKANLLSGELDRIIEHFQKKATSAKRIFYIYKYSSIALAVLTTVITSLQTIYPDDLPKWILPIISALATVSVTLLGASSAQSIWTNSKTTQQRLQAEKILFFEEAEKYKEQGSKEERIKLLSEQFIHIWNQGHNKWEQGINNS